MNVWRINWIILHKDFVITGLWIVYVVYNIINKIIWKYKHRNVAKLFTLLLHAPSRRYLCCKNEHKVTYTQEMEWQQ